MAPQNLSLLFSNVSLPYRSPESHKYERRVHRGLCSDDSMRGRLTLTTCVPSSPTGACWAPCTNFLPQMLGPFSIPKYFIRSKRENLC